MDIIKFILDNKITTDNWDGIKACVDDLVNDHDGFIRTLALMTSNGDFGKGDERAEALGVYNDEVQDKINWAYKAAQDVWKGVYGNGDKRKEALGEDYNLVQYWVKVVKPSIYGPSDVHYTTDNGGKRYVITGVPTAKGTTVLKAYNQHSQGSNPFVFDGSGCGFMSFYSAISTILGLNDMPITFAEKNLKRVTGTSKCPISIWAGCKLLDDSGIRYTWVKGPLTTDGCREDIQAHLERGMPVIVSLSYADRAGKITKAYTNYAHYSILWFTTKDGKWYLFDSGGRKPRYVDPYDICKYIPGTKKEPDYSPTWNGWSNAGGYVKIEM